MPKNINAITSGLITLCRTSPNLSQSQLNGFSAAGWNSVAASKSAASPPVQRHEWPPSHQLSSETPANPVAITIPKDRAEPPTTVSSRE